MEDTTKQEQLAWTLLGLLVVGTLIFDSWAKRYRQRALAIPVEGPLPSSSLRIKPELAGLEPSESLKQWLDDHFEVVPCGCG